MALANGIRTRLSKAMVSMGFADALVDAVDNNTVLSAIQAGGAFGATITTGAAHTSAVNVSFQLTDEDGANVAETVATDVFLFTTAAAVVINPETLDSVVATTNGIVVLGVADEHYKVVTEATGVVDLTFTDATGTGTLYAGIVLANGTMAFSGAVTFTA